jgi:predicted RNase H-like HicB family nuclease
MQPDLVSSSGTPLLVQVRQDGAGRYTAEVVGLPALQATAGTRDEALGQLRDAAAQWLASGELVPLTIPSTLPRRKPTGWAQDDPLEQEFVEDLAQRRREDLARTLREYEQEDSGCSGTSSTPTT